MLFASPTRNVILIFSYGARIRRYRLLFIHVHPLRQMISREKKFSRNGRRKAYINFATSVAEASRIHISAPVLPRINLAKSCPVSSPTPPYSAESFSA